MMKSIYLIGMKTNASFYFISPLSGFVFAIYFNFYNPYNPLGLKRINHRFV